MRPAIGKISQVFRLVLRPVRRRVFRLALAVTCGLLLVGVIPQASASAASITCGDVVTSSIRLQADLVCGTGDGLRVEADNVVLDLGGHTITGPGNRTPGGGVRVAFHHGVTVRDGLIRGFAEGVVLDTATGNQVTRLTLTGNGRGVNLANANTNLVAFNRISQNTGDGIRLGASSRNLVQYNILTDNVFGIGAADASDSNQITGNIVVHSRDFGISLFVDSDSNVVSYNWVFDGTVDGVAITAGSDDAAVYRNVVASQGRDGIFVDAASLRTALRENTANRNGDDGIDIDSGSAILTANHADNNTDLGIEAAAGVTDGGGNTARGNGNPAQCAGVSCSLG